MRKIRQVWKVATVVAMVNLLTMMPPSTSLGSQVLAEAPEKAITRAEQEEVTFSDQNLERVIRMEIGKPEEEPIYTTDLERITELDVSSMNVICLTGLEHCTNLTELTLAHNRIVIGDIKFTSDDGVNLENKLLTPDSSLHAGVIIYHGFDGSKEDLYSVALRLAEEGYVVLTYDHRAHGESEGDLNWEKLIEDAKTAIGCLEEKLNPGGLSDANHIIGAVGHSVGGMIAIMVSDKDPRVSATVSISAPKSLDSILLHHLKSERSIDCLRHVLPITASSSCDDLDKIDLSFIFTNLKTNLGDLRKFYLDSPCLMNYVGDVDKILFLQGTADEMVNPKDAYELYRMAPEPKDLIYIGDADHSSIKELEEVSIYISDWFKDHLLEEVPTPHS
jgi:fermentation-respiration switch protein FrsA (DUF1100 family)